MSPRIKPEPSSLPLSRSTLVRIRPRVWACLFFLVAAGVAAHFLWQRERSNIARDGQFLLTSDRIHITPPPPWIRTDIKAAVLQDSDLADRLTVLDDLDTLGAKIKEAFEFHPWVESVKRIALRVPSSIEIELTYRRPVAAVESRDAGGVMFLPIDEHAIRLPEGDLTETERQHLPRVAGITGRPLVGDAWDDPRVVGGAKLAAQLADIWQQLRLVEIIATPGPTANGAPPVYTFDLVTTGGTKIVWGAAPGQESAHGESPFNEKRARIIDYAAQHGRLESIDGPAELDVRSELVVTPRTARRSPDGTKLESTKTK